MRLHGSVHEKQEQARVNTEIQKNRDKIEIRKLHPDKIPKMPALIPLCTTDQLKMNILNKIKLVAIIEHALLREQKKLQLLWKEKHIRKIKKYPSKQKEKVKGKNDIQVTRTLAIVQKNTNLDMEKVVKDREEVKQFRHFWRFYESFKDEDDNDDLENDKSPVSIEDLVVDEVSKYRMHY